MFFLNSLSFLQNSEASKNSMAPKQLNVEQIDFNINYGSEYMQNVIINHEFEQTIFPIAFFSSEYTTEIDNDNTDMINAIYWANAQFHSYLHRNNNLTSHNHTKTTPSHHKKQQPKKPKFHRKMNKQKQTGKTHKFNSKKFHFKSKQATR